MVLKVWQTPSGANNSFLFSSGPTICSLARSIPTPRVASSSRVCWVTADQCGALTQIKQGPSYSCCRAEGLSSGSVGSRTHWIIALRTGCLLGTMGTKSLRRIVNREPWIEQMDNDDRIQNNMCIILIAGFGLFPRSGHTPALGTHGYPYVLSQNVF